ncbi:type I polyketide synthase [Streptomyces sp. NPDC020898]|uniref:type I polyketide synthase n=1 Tax=Streptomyces sp. NPDC020898 TaxID=3365101 RepID=UPI0037A4B0F5
MALTGQVWGAESIVEATEGGARRLPDKVAIIGLEDGEREAEAVTFAQLDSRARSFATHLQTEGLAGERVLIMLPQGVEYAVAFLGCLYANAVAVPAFPPNKSRRGERVEGIVRDCAPRLAVVAAQRADALRTQLPADCAVMTADELTAAAPSQWARPEIDPDGVAYLQYTSGSSGTPRGVMVTQRNVMHQLRLLHHALELREDEVSVSWLPMFHDFGLVAGLLYPLTVGATNVMMAPVAFVQQPLRWLTAVTRYRAAITFGPNFALDLCCDRIGSQDRAGLELSSLRLLVMGSEPIRPQSMERFASDFSHYGFSVERFAPGYGMAESTLAVTVRACRDPLTITSFDIEELSRGRLKEVPDGYPASRRLPSNGNVSLDTELLIVDPDTCEPCPDGLSGEIWLAGRTVTPGYWGRPDETEQAFGARLADGRGPFLRTGDLGARIGRHTYITGRRKDLIIVRGVNHYPQDIELTVAEAHPALPRDKGVAFSVDIDGEERLVIVSELARSHFRTTDPEDIARSVQLAVAEEHELAAEAIVLLRPAQLPVTSSGKVRRQTTKQLYLAGELSPFHTFPAYGAVARTLARPPRADTPGSHAALVAWLAGRIAERTKIAPKDVSADAPFGAFGLDSGSLVGLSGELSEHLGRPVEATDMYDHPTIARLADALLADVPEVTAAAGTAEVVDERAGKAEPTAIVGMACRVPGAGSVEEFWELLAEGRDALREIPPERERLGYRFDDGQPHFGGFISGVDEFDPGFFGISRTEGESMDPQQRLLLTTVWRALEDAGVSRDAIAGSRTGVFVGISTNDYRQLQARDGAGTTAHDGTGTALSIAANRISYHFDLRGPSQAVDTACSSSLVALHQACSSLQHGECDTAIVAGVNLLLDPALTTVFAKAGMLAPDGRCKTFDAHADGYVRGEGCGVVVLKRHRDARRAHDRIHALVRGSAVNSDGQSNTLTAPNGPAQQEVMLAALAAAGTPPKHIGYVEAHGTGTPLGDPIEMAALRTVYEAADGSPLWVGSVKTNIGHLEAAAGIIGLIKTTLCLQHREIPASLHFSLLNPYIDLEGSRCRIPTATTPWPDSRSERAAAVSSFGFGGTNAHVILSEAPRQEAPRPISGDTAWSILPISAKSRSALRQLAEGYADLLTARPAGDLPLPSITHTAGARRTHHDHRLAVLARSADEAAELLDGYGRGEPSSELAVGIADRQGGGPVALLFTGQGSQYRGMAKALYFRHAAFRDAVDRCDAVIRAELGASLLPTLCDAPGEQVDLDMTLYAQPAVFVVDYALASMWQACGLRPDYVLGHSLGEYVAACVAGAVTLTDALRLVVARARCMQDLAAPGSMYAVHADEELLAELLGELVPGREVAVAAYNGPEDVVVSGSETATAEIVDGWRERGARVTRLNGSRAFHSPLMSEAVTEFERFAATITFRPPRIPLLSNLTGEPVKTLTARYLARHCLEPVRFAKTLNTLARVGCATVVECGPHPVLSPLAERMLPGSACLPSLHREDVDDQRFQRSLAQWYVRGGNVDWTGVLRERLGDQVPPPLPVPLPPYPLATNRYWYRKPDGTSHPLVGTPVDLAGTEGRWFTQTLDAERPWFLDQHRVWGTAVLPAAAMAEGAHAALSEVAGAGSWTLEHLTFNAFLPFHDATPVGVQTLVESTADGYRVRCFSRAEGAKSWTEHATVASATPTAAPRPGPVALDRLRQRMSEQNPQTLYETLHELGLGYGPVFRGLQSLWRGQDEALGEIRVDDAAPDGDAYQLHPVVLDACFHVAAAFLKGDGELLLPVAVDRISVHSKLPSHVWSHARRRAIDGSGDLLLDLDIVSEHGEPLALVEGMRLRPVTAGALTGPDGPPLNRYETTWLPLTRRAPGTGTTLRQGTWLVCGADQEKLQHWRDELAGLGIPAVGLLVGPDEPSLPDLLYADQDSAEGIARLFAKLRTRTADIAGLILHGGPSTASGAPAEDTYRLARRTFDVLRYFLSEFAAGRPEVVLCSAGAVAVPGSDTGVDLPQTVLTAAARTVVAEYPDLKCVQVDLDPSGTAPPLRDILGRAVDLPGCGHLAVRGGRWSEARLQETTVERRAKPVRIRDDACYLVTGGYGGLGLAVATWLADQGARHLLLAGRTPPAEPPVEVIALRARGVRVELWQADVADPEAVRELIGRARRELPPLRGVVHTAGVHDDALLDQLDWARFGPVLDPKVRGAWNLHRSTEDLDLDLFVLFSSLASLIGSPGQSNYVTANAFLDGLAQYRHHQGRPALSVNWGPWSEAGMAAHPELLARLARQGIAGIGTERALSALGALISDGSVSAGLAEVDWHRWERFRISRLPYTLLGDLVPAFAAGRVDTHREEKEDAVAPALLVLQDPAAARAAVQGALLDRVGELLGLDSVERDELQPTFSHVRLNELGLDSLMAVRLRNRLLSDFATDVPPHFLFAGNTVTDVVELICRQLTLKSVVATDDSTAEYAGETEILTL